ncbi:PBSX family phage terminase large subunit [Agrobacterium larrymoorei]|uniref:PBSX family phage terminase large subunit n=1 Tax=Agrobacterium larrymoorei TaxID=160699 RepID=UPI0030BD88DD
MAKVQIPRAFRFLFDERMPDGSPIRYRAAYGGRGSGKSHAFAAALVIKARQKPIRVLCAREIQKSIKDSVKRLLDDKIREMGFGQYFRSTDTEIKGTNGSHFVFAGLRSNVESIKSLEGIDIAWVEEATTVSQSSLTNLGPTIRKDGSEIWFTWNPRHESDPVDSMFRLPSGAPPRSIVRRVNWDLNPFFPDVLREDMEWDASRDPDKYRHIWLGEYLRNSEARVFHNWKVEQFDTPADARFYLGADWGFSIDPTVLVRCFIMGRTLFVDREVYKVGCEIDRTPDLFDRLDQDNLKMARNWPITADSARPETIDYMKRHGYTRIKPAKKGAGSVEDGIEFLKSYDIVVHPRCKHMVDELTLYSWKTDPVTDEVLPLLNDKNNHVIDALRYAVEGLRGSNYTLSNVG